MTETIDYTKFDFERDVNLKVSEALRLAPSDPEKAAEVLLLAAEFMRSGQPMPMALVDYVAGAFHAAMSKPAKHRVRELALELNLEGTGRRPMAFGWIDAMKIIQTYPNLSNAEYIKTIMKHGDCSMTHARGLLKLALEASENYEEMMRQERIADQ